MGFINGFEPKLVEAFKRADVHWRKDEIDKRCIVFSSHNRIEPLTDKEKEMVKKYVKKSPFKITCRFE